MKAVIELPRSPSSLGRSLRLAGASDSADPRAEALADYDRRLDNLRCCVHWLVDNGVKVIESMLCRQGGIVKVAASPNLPRLLGGECSWRKRRQDGALTIFTWFAVRYGTRIEWEDVTCA